MTGVLVAISCIAPPVATPTSTTAGPVPGSGTATCSGPVLGSTGTGLALLGVFFAALGLLFIVWRFTVRDTVDDHGNRIPLIHAPYMTWFLIHFVIPAIGVLAVVGLAIDGVIDATVVSALLGSLISYVLGASTKSATSGITGTSTGKSAPVASRLWPASGPVAGATSVTITGSGFPTSGPVPAVRFGAEPAAAVYVMSATVLVAQTPAVQTVGHVSVAVVLADGTSIGSTDLEFAFQ